MNRGGGALDKTEFAWRLYESERDFIKHHENQRTNASSILSAIAAALIVAFATSAPLGVSRLLISMTLAFVGVYGTIFSGKLYELIQLHASRSYEYLRIVGEGFPEVDVKAIKAGVKEKQRLKFPFFADLSLNSIWFRFHIFVSWLGFLLAGITLCQMLGWFSLVL